MVVDSSALIAILQLEPEAEAFTTALHDAAQPLLSAATYVEASVLIGSRRGEGGVSDLDELISQVGIEIMPLTLGQALIARDAYARYGKGRHPASLNLGDCFAYALAKERDLPLMFKGNDFALTDIVSAI